MPILTSRHIAILAAVARLEPCSAGAVARHMAISFWTARAVITQTLYRHGLVDWATDRRYPQPRRQKCTIRVTEDGRRLLKQLNGDAADELP